jgi:hypothetical protein
MRLAMMRGAMPAAVWCGCGVRRLKSYFDVELTAAGDNKIGRYQGGSQVTAKA